MISRPYAVFGIRIFYSYPKQKIIKQGESYEN